MDAGGGADVRLDGFGQRLQGCRDRHPQSAAPTFRVVSLDPGGVVTVGSQG
jgi:hypothetical protein